MVDQNYYKHLQVWCTMKLHMTNASNNRLSGIFCLKDKGPGAIIFQNVNVIKDEKQGLDSVPDLKKFKMHEIPGSLFKHIILEGNEMWLRTWGSWLQKQHMMVYVSRWMKTF